MLWCGVDCHQRFVLEERHTEVEPRLIRLAEADRGADFWAFARDGPAAQVAADLLGPDIKFHHAKLNFKEADGGEKVSWHQDIQVRQHRSAACREDHSCSRHRQLSC